MKKTLFTLGAFALVVLGFAACGNSDCTCKISEEGIDVSTNIPVKDFDGDCDEVTMTDLGKDADGTLWTEIFPDGKVTCEED